MTPALARFVVAFKIIPTSLFGLPRDMSDDPEPRGDCQDFAKTVKRIEGVKFPKAIVIRGWSPLNWKPPFLPRHAVLWVKGKGFIDSTRREYRKWPWPHIPAWPVGAPVVLGVAWAAKWWGVW